MAGPTLTPDVAANPFVEVFFEDLHTDAARLDVYRLSDDREWLVRGGVDVAAGVAALDFEVPFKTQASYRAVQRDVLGNSLGFTDTSTITVDYTGTVVHQPLVPAQLWAPVTLMVGSGQKLLRPAEGDLVGVEGAAMDRWIGTPRRGLRGVPVRFMAETIEAADLVQAMLGTYVTKQIQVLCIRTSEVVRWPRTFFARGDLTEVEKNVRLGGHLLDFEASMDESEPPYPGLVVPLLTYDDLDAFGDYAAQDAGWITYTARDRAYELAGLAG